MILIIGFTLVRGVILFGGGMPASINRNIEG